MQAHGEAHAIKIRNGFEETLKKKNPISSPLFKHNPLCKWLPFMSSILLGSVLNNSSNSSMLQTLSALYLVRTSGILSAAHVFATSLLTKELSTQSCPNKIMMFFKLLKPPTAGFEVITTSEDAHKILCLLLLAWTTYGVPLALVLANHKTVFSTSLDDHTFGHLCCASAPWSTAFSMFLLLFGMVKTVLGDTAEPFIMSTFSP